METQLVTMMMMSQCALVISPLPGNDGRHCFILFFSQHTSTDDGRGQVSSHFVRSSRSKTSSSTPDETPHVGNYRLLKTIGKGNFAKVKLARHVLTGREVRLEGGGVDGTSESRLTPCCCSSSSWQVAIKIIDKTQLNPTSLQKVRRSEHGSVPLPPQARCLLSNGLANRAVCPLVVGCRTDTMWPINE